MKIERRVLTALRDRLLNQELCDEFRDEFTREMSRLRMEYRASLTAAERELERIEVRRQKLIEMVMQGVPASEVRDEMTENTAGRGELKAKLAAATEPPAPPQSQHGPALPAESRRPDSGAARTRHADRSDESIDELLQFSRMHSPVCNTVCRPVPITLERIKH